MHLGLLEEKEVSGLGGEGGGWLGSLRSRCRGMMPACMLIIISHQVQRDDALTSMKQAPSHAAHRGQLVGCRLPSRYTRAATAEAR